MGISRPSAILCLAAEGIARKIALLKTHGQETLVIKGSELNLPETRAKGIDIDFSGMKIKNSQRALAALALLANEVSLLNKEMLAAGISHRYHGKMLEESMAVTAQFN